MPARFTKIDDLTRAAHYHLTPDDDCYYLREYTSHKGSGASDTNNLILNFKKEPDRVGRPEWRYKEEAVRQLAAECNQWRMDMGANPSVENEIGSALRRSPPMDVARHGAR